MRAAPVRVAICSDSRSYAAGLRRFLETDPQLRVVTVATSGEQLIGELGRLQPDLITMDLELPGIDGVETIRRIMATTAIPIVVISTRTAEGPDGLVTAALAGGAREAVPKSDVRVDRRLSPPATALRRRLTRLVRADDDAPAATTAGRAPWPTDPREDELAPAEAAEAAQPAVATVVGVAASAGGPGGLSEVLGALPADFDLPVLVVQHIADGFADGLATWLDSVIPLPVRLAQDGERAGHGVTIAPDSAHLLLTPDRRLRLDRETVCGRHRPSADVLLTSLAEVAGPGVVAVVLSGMGRDGAAGVAAVRRAGGTALAEQPEQAPVSGMPGAAEEAGATPLERAEIGRVLAELSRSGGA
jgi:two-component system chemotaxis response regulator CheB